MSFTGHVQNGVVIFDEPITLPDGTKVEIATCSLDRDEKIVEENARETGLCYEGNVLVHRGTCTPKQYDQDAVRDERMEQLRQGLLR